MAMPSKWTRRRAPQVQRVRRRPIVAPRTPSSLRVWRDHCGIRLARRVLRLRACRSFRCSSRCSPSGSSWPPSGSVASRRRPLGTARHQGYRARLDLDEDSEPAIVTWNWGRAHTHHPRRPSQCFHEVGNHLLCHNLENSSAQGLLDHWHRHLGTHASLDNQSSSRS